MSFCTQCTHALADDARFCPACGAPTTPAVMLAAATAAGSIAATVTTPATGATPPSGSHGRFDPGTRLGTRYRVVALLGRGGMGEVYRADDLELGQSVALKFLPAGLAASPAELGRFRGEVRTARSIAHPNVCRVYDIGDADGHVFLSMEYIDGEDLASVLRRMGRPTRDKAVEIARQVCLGLAAAHEAGLLHRDLKPANVMIDGRGRARITDFGLAGLIDELAHTGEIAGTPAYMAPEQLAGGHVSVRSDLYSLGLVLYELFTGKRALAGATMAELRHQQESGSITTPSDLARDLDPAIERVILHCLERDPESRPPSAYAVLGALPGGDPLAAALAAGETPSPELVANAGDRGSLPPLVAVGLVAAGLVGLGLCAGITGPDFRAATTAPEVLSVRAADLLAHTGSFTTLPEHSVQAFEQNNDYLQHLRKDRSARDAKRSAIDFWKRWSPRPIEAPNLHTEQATAAYPPLVATGQAIVILDPAGRLAGLRAVPPDSVPSANGGRPAWSVLWAASGLDSAAFRPVPVTRALPAMCDSAAAWTGPVPWQGGEPVTVTMGASRGRLTYFSLRRDWGTTTAVVDSVGIESDSPTAAGDLLLYLVMLAAAVYFGSRNQQLGRGDWRGATRIAVFVLVMNLLEGVFGSRMLQYGPIGFSWDLTGGRAAGHALLHAVTMWFSYMALEPYLRRLWPRLLVSWSRLVSGRVRDPLVGRDILVGGATGSLLPALGMLAAGLGARFGGTSLPSYIGDGQLQSLTGLGPTACQLAYAGSICVLEALRILVLVLIMRLALRRTDVAVVVTCVLTATLAAVPAAAYNGWPVAIVGGVLAAASIVVLMRIGVLAGVTAGFFGLVMSQTVATFDVSAWYAGRALLPMALLLALLVYGAATALAGRPILGDPLREPART